MSRVWFGFAGVFCLLSGIYFLFYSGVPISGDEVALYASAEGVAKFGEFRMYSATHYYPLNSSEGIRQPAQEPLHFLLSVPLYLLAFYLKPLGLIHTVWLFNIFVIATTGGLIMLSGLRWGYRYKTSLILALLVGTGTMLLPYSRYYFREPLLGLFSLLIFIVGIEWRAKPRPWLIVLFGLFWLAAILSKQVGLALLPLILWFVVPESLLRSPRYIAALTLGSLLAILLLLFVLLPALGNLLNTDRFGTTEAREWLFAFDLPNLAQTFGAYILSPGRSWWATQPILLLSLYGTWLLYRQKSPFFAFAPWLALLSLTLTYGIASGDWAGGLGWGTRYLVSLTPILGLLLLPVIEKAGETKRLWLVILPLYAFSLILQISSGWLPITDYYDHMLAKFPDKGAAAYVEEGTWQIQDTQLAYHLSHIQPKQISFAWHYADSPAIIPVMAILIISIGIFILWRRPRWMKHWHVLLIFPLVTALLCLGLLSLRHDPRLQGERDDIRAAIHALEARVTADELLLLNNPEYAFIFLNEYRGIAPLVPLAYQRGERYELDKPDSAFDEFDFDGDGIIDMNERLNPSAVYLLNYIGNHYDSVWLVSNFSQFMTWTFRPLEHMMVNRFYPIEESNPGETLRLIHFHIAPLPDHPHYVYIKKSFEFGDQITLSYAETLNTLRAGEILPLRLHFSPQTELSEDAENYNVGVLLLDENGRTVAQQNGRPQGTFGFPNQREAHAGYSDNHGLAIPPGLPAGHYELQVVIYDWQTVERLPVFLDGEAQADDAARIIEVEITP